MKIHLSGVRNIRDFSEYGLAGYMRSAHLHALTGKDAATLTKKYGLRTVIDLRTAKEVEEKPDVPLPGVQYYHIPLFEEAVPGISHEKATDEILSMLPDMAAMYRALVTQQPYVGQIQKVMAVINDPARQGAVLWHCTEGKDRCGIISALVLLANGVTPRQVMRDYLKTNRANFCKAWKYYVLILLAGKGRATAARLRDAFLAKRAYLAPIMEDLTALAETSATKSEK